MLTSSQIQQVSALLQGKKHILIFTHIAPDGDAMGSSLGLMHWLRANMPELEEVHVVVPTPFPPFLAWMPGADEVMVHTLQAEEIQTVAQRADLAFCLDFNEPKRIESVASLLTSLTCPKVLIDHHLHPDETMVDCVVSYPEAPAASYLVLELINALNQSSLSNGHTSLVDSSFPASPLAPVGAQPSEASRSSSFCEKERGRGKGALSSSAATCLYTGLMTDTGNFAFNSNRPELYEMIAELLRAGINKDEIFDNVFNQYSVERLRFTGYCLYHKMRIFPKYHTALIALSSEELRRFNFQSGDAEGIVNMPLQIGTIKYSVFMREDVDKIKMSFRSQGDRPVNIFAREIFNGGGHMNAAGGESHLSLAATVKLFEDNYQHFFSRD